MHFQKPSCAETNVCRAASPPLDAKPPSPRASSTAKIARPCDHGAASDKGVYFLHVGMLSASLNNLSPSRAASARGRSPHASVLDKHFQIASRDLQSSSWHSSGKEIVDALRRQRLNSLSSSGVDKLARIAARHAAVKSADSHRDLVSITSCTNSCNMSDFCAHRIIFCNVDSSSDALWTRSATGPPSGIFNFFQAAATLKTKRPCHEAKKNKRKKN